MVRLQKDTTVQTTVEDILMSITAVSGKLFRCVEMVAQEANKVFLKFDDKNLQAWAYRQSGLGETLKAIVYPEDYCRVFSNDQCLLAFSEPWRKYRDGKQLKNVLEIPNAKSVAYAESMMKKLPEFGDILPFTKKRVHMPSPKSLATPAIDLTGEKSTPVSSPSHKVQVVEQRSVATRVSAGGEHSTVSSGTTNETKRIEALDSVVQDHGKQLKDIQLSMNELDGKILKNHEETRLSFVDFKDVLGEIRFAVTGKVPCSAGQHNSDEGMDDWADRNDEEGGCYNPVTAQAYWQEQYRRYNASVCDARAHRAECEQELRRERAGGDAVDYSKVAYERYPSPQIPDDWPDDITLDY